MRDILFSNEISEELNQNVRQKISAHLFLSCNYQPKQMYFFSEDAKFCIGALNLYEFAVGSSCIISRIHEIAPECSAAEYEKLSEDILQIKTIRDALAHNSGDSEGYIRAEQLARYEKWLSRIIKKDHPVSCEDYEAACHELSEMGKRVVSTLFQFIDEAARLPRKDEMIVKWENQILEWYCTGKPSIFLGQMADAYLARAVGNGLSYEAARGQIEYKVANWIRNFFLHEIEETAETKLQLWKSYGEKLPMDKREYLAKSVREEVDKQAQKKKELIQKICSIFHISESGVTAFKYQEYFFLGLESRLRRTMKDSHCNMLPQDLLQRQIEICFRNVHSEDFD